MLPHLPKHIDKKDKKVYNRTQRDKNKKRGGKTNERRKKECKNIGFGLWVFEIHDEKDDDTDNEIDTYSDKAGEI